MKNKKLKTMLLSLGLVGTIGVGATLAYFSDATDPVKNTFTVSKGITDLQLDELRVNSETHRPYYKDVRVTENEYKNIQPGEVLVKDPTVHINTTVPCYVFVSIENKNSDVLTPNLDSSKWYEVKVDENTNANLKFYVYADETGSPKVVNPTNDVYENLVVFNEVKVLNELGETDQPTIEGSGEINVKAAAVQSDNIAYEDAKDIAIGKLN